MKPRTGIDGTELPAVTFLRNIWYAAAWSHDVGENLFTRKILGDAVLIYRTGDGTPAAISDRCPHRFAPLHVGRRVDDTIECGYHGLRFNGRGECVRNPYGKQAIAQTLNVRSFPLVERHGVLWIWPGDPASADRTTIPDFGYLTEATHKSLYGTVLVRANYELIHDNVMDTSHSEYIHADLTATGALDPANFKVSSGDGKGVDSSSLFPDVEVPAAYKPYFADPKQRVDRSMTFQWVPPSLIRNRTLLAPVGRPEHEGIERIGTHFLTPETEKTTHYLFAHTRNYRLDDAAIDEATRTWQWRGIDGQDRPIVEAVQACIDDAPDPHSLRPALLSVDTAAVRVQRILARLIAEERTGMPNGTAVEAGTR